MTGGRLADSRIGEAGLDWQIAAENGRAAR